MSRLISEIPTEGLVCRWVDEDVAEFIEALPKFGEGRITIVDGRVTGNIAITETFLYTGRRKRQQRKPE